MRLGDLDALKEVLNDAYEEYDGYDPHDLRRYAERVDEEIDNAPPIETTIENLISALSVEELKVTTWIKVDTPDGEAICFRREKTGHWIEVKDKFAYVTWYHWDCSECKAQYGKTYNFCPNCGAKMKEETENDI